MDALDVLRTYEAYKNVLHMMKMRGYSIPEISSPEKFIEEYVDGEDGSVRRDDIFLMACKEADGKDQELDIDDEIKEEVVAIMFCDSDNIGIPHARNILTTLEAQDEIITSLILIARQGVTASAKRELSSSLTTEVFLEKDIAVNITEHRFVYRHILLGPAEEENVRKKYRIVSDNMLPKILESDPICRRYGFQKGQMIKTIRPSETAGRITEYRLVC